MIKKIKLGLLTAVASAILALPVAASAATPSRVLSTTSQNIEIIQVPIIFEHNPPGDHNPPDDRNLLEYRYYTTP